MKLSINSLNNGLEEDGNGAFNDFLIKNRKLQKSFLIESPSFKRKNSKFENMFINHSFIKNSNPYYIGSIFTQINNKEHDLHLKTKKQTNSVPIKKRISNREISELSIKFPLLTERILRENSGKVNSLSPKIRIKTESIRNQKFFDGFLKKSGSSIKNKNEKFHSLTPENSKNEYFQISNKQFFGSKLGTSRSLMINDKNYHSHSEIKESSIQFELQRKKTLERIFKQIEFNKTISRINKDIESRTKLLINMYLRKDQELKNSKNMNLRLVVSLIKSTNSPFLKNISKKSKLNSIQASNLLLKKLKNILCNIHDLTNDELLTKEIFNSYSKAQILLNKKFTKDLKIQKKLKITEFINPEILDHSDNYTERDFKLPHRYELLTQIKELNREISLNRNLKNKLEKFAKFKFENIRTEFEKVNLELSNTGNEFEKVIKKYYQFDEKKKELISNFRTSKNIISKLRFRFLKKHSDSIDSEI